jgi:hypothetical protein
MYMVLMDRCEWESLFARLRFKEVGAGGWEKGGDNSNQLSN